MPITLSGKFWRVDEIAQKFFIPKQKVFNAVRYLNGIIRVGMVVLIPDELVDELGKKLSQGNMGDSISLSTAGRLAGAGANVVFEVVQCGFPHTTRMGVNRIERKHLDALKRAFDHYRQLDGKVSVVRARQICELAKKYLEEQPKND